MKLPGLIDIHVHIREPGATHKEDWSTGTAAALAGGLTAVLAMPNTLPPIMERDSLNLSLAAAGRKAHCDYAQYLGAGVHNSRSLADLSTQVAGLKMYLNDTFGKLEIDDMTIWMKHLMRAPRSMPVVAHAEGQTAAAFILLAELCDRPVHIAHVSRREEIQVIRRAKERGLKVTCEVCPHHLFLTREAIPRLGLGRSEVRPRLARPADREALWENLDVIDCFATDHAPHTAAEKDDSNPPPGFPGLETMLSLLLTAVRDGRLTIDDIVERLFTNPRRIFALPAPPETWVEVDLDRGWTIRAGDFQSRCGWSPFEGWEVTGRVERVVIRGREAYRDGSVVAPPGFGRNLRQFELENIQTTAIGERSITA